MTRIVRQDNTQWGYKVPAQPDLAVGLSQIQIITPATQKARVSFELGKFVAKAFKQTQINSKEQLAKGMVVSITNPNSQVKGRYRVKLVTYNSIMDRLWQFFPWTRVYPNQRIAQVQVVKDSWWQQLIHRGSSPLTHSFAPEKAIKFPESELPIELDATLETRKTREAFSDPFTELATKFLQTVDPYWVSELQVQAAFRFVLGPNGTLKLVPLKAGSQTPQEIEENKRVAVAYKQFIKTEFGLHKLAYVNTAYGFSLDTIIEKGLPLVPDHIFKMNIGMNNIELKDLQLLYEKMQTIDLTKQAIDKTRLGDPDYFSLHELRGIAKAGAIAQLPVVKSVRDLPVEQFNYLASIVMPTDEERLRAYTGRKIRSLAIGGENTMGDPNVNNPSRTLFELLQIFENLTRPNDWNNFFELMALVTSKKNLYLKSTRFEKQLGYHEWHVGLLVPAPATADGKKRYYVMDSFFDDGQGNINQCWLPACKHYKSEGKACPFMKIYRSTATTPAFEDYDLSYFADINPFGSPSTLEPSLSYFIEKKYFDRCTIPLWSGYYLAAEQNPAKRDELSIKGLREYHRCLQAPGPTPPDVLQEASAILAAKDAKRAYEFIKRQAKFHEELPEYKIAQDVATSGHSLGGSLAQFGNYYYGIKRARIPLPNCNYHVYSTHGAATDTPKDEAFMNFGRTNSELLTLLGQRWKVHHLFEMGDIVPLFGRSHYGTNGYVETDSLWLETHYSLFTPLETAKNKCITTITCHSRRIGTAIEGRDYRLTPLTPQTLYQYDHSWWLGKKLDSIWQYRILRTPKMAELVRSVFAKVVYPLVWIWIRLQRTIWPPVGHRTKEGVFFLIYHRPNAL